MHINTAALGMSYSECGRSQSHRAWWRLFWWGGYSLASRHGGCTETQTISIRDLCSVTFYSVSLWWRKRLMLKLADWKRMGTDQRSIHTTVVFLFSLPPQGYLVLLMLDNTAMCSLWCALWAHFSNHLTYCPYRSLVGSISEFSEI